jgi:3-oxoacyl-[acyl-carrier-protein] synthase II
VDYISASANGGLRLDRLEADALSDLFGPSPEGPRIGSVKGAIGESFSSGGIRAAAMALSLKDSMIPPTLGLEDPLAPLNFVRGAKAALPLAHGLVNGFSSGGTFVSLLMKRLT